MPLVDPIRRSISLKFVYYGPTGVGKTASLKLLDQRLQQGLYRAAPLGRRPGRLLSLDTLGGRTLFFDILSIAATLSSESNGRSDPRGATRLLLRLFSVPGGEMHGHTRRLLLRGADGIMLVGDRSAQLSSSPSGQASLSELRTNLRESGINFDDLPILAQPSPNGGGGDVAVVESLLSLVTSSWPSAQSAATDAGLSGCELSRVVSSLRLSLGVPARPEAPPARPEPVLWTASGRAAQARVMP